MAIICRPPGPSKEEAGTPAPALDAGGTDGYNQPGKGAGAVVIDIHTHLGRGEPDGDRLQRDLLPELLLRIMDEAGVERSVIFPVTYRDYRRAIEELAGYREEHPDRFILFGRVGNTPEAADIVRWAYETHGIKGCKFHHGLDRFEEDSPHLLEALAACQELGLVAIFDAFDRNAFKVSPLAGRFPRLTIIMAHMGGLWKLEAIDHCIETARKHPNVMLDTAAIVLFQEIERAAREIGAERILFGSDAPGIHPGPEKAKIEYLHLSAEEKALILGGNAARLLGIET